MFTARYGRSLYIQSGQFYSLKVKIGFLKPKLSVCTHSDSIAGRRGPDNSDCHVASSTLHFSLGEGVSTLYRR